MPLTANAAFTDRHRLRTIEIAAPGPGLAADYTIAEGEVLQVVAIRLRLATAVAVADRRIEIFHLDALGFWPMYAAASSVVQTANLTWNYRFACGLSPIDATADASDVYAPLACGLQLYGEELLRFACSGIQVADQISQVYIRCYHWKED